MPIYEYQCQACGHDMETIQKMSDDRLKDCPACGKPELKKLISAAAFQLKGSGWYETDFKGGKKKPAKGADAAPSKPEKSEPKAVSKPAGESGSGNHKH